MIITYLIQKIKIFITTNLSNFVFKIKLCTLPYQIKKIIDFYTEYYGMILLFVFISNTHYIHVHNVMNVIIYL